ncbi:unknown [Sinorhizobium phage PBC5]|nr:unknown [Sinorhizobium phage PBC5]
MKFTSAALMLAVTLLAGCQSKQYSEMSSAERHELAGQIAQRCIDKGYTKKSQQADACLRLEAEREYAKMGSGAENTRQVGLALSQGFSNYGETMSSQPLTLSPSTHRPIRCTSTSYSGSVDTTCY